MRKTNLLFYSCLNYHEDNVRLLEEHFTCQMLPDPSFASEQVLKEVEYLAAPLGFKLSAKKIYECRNLKAIFSNTTGIPHSDVDFAESRGIEVISLKGEHNFLGSITPTAEHTCG